MACLVGAVVFTALLVVTVLADPPASYLQQKSLLEYFLKAENKDQAYELYRSIYNKNAKDMSKIDTERRDTFFQNLKAAYDAMIKDGFPYSTGGVSELSDLTDSEFVARLGLVDSGLPSSATAQSNGRKLYSNVSATNDMSDLTRRMLQGSGGDAAKLAKLPATVWSLADVNRPGNQANCGSCWAWAAAHMGEFTLWDASARRGAAGGGKFQSISKSQVAMCTPGYLDEGNSPCLGGDPTAALAYLRLKSIAPQGFLDDEQVGAVTKGSFGVPATAETVAEDVFALSTLLETAGGCPAGTNKDMVAQGFHIIPQTEKAMLAALQYGPVMIGVNGHDGWQTSQGNLIQWPDCPSDSQNHAVIIVGAGTAEDVNGNMVDYWLIRNSWGSTWGDGTGHIKLPRVQNATYPNGTCAIYVPGSEAVALNATTTRRRSLAESDCVDTLEEINCKVWAAAGFCALSYTWLGQSVAYTWCPETCKQCGTSDCKDMDTSCELWASDGFCTAVFAYNGRSIPFEVCTQSCGTCAAVVAQEEFNVTSCKDVKHSGIDCKGWAAKGYCAPEYTWNLLSISQVWCQATCKSCSTAPQCQDKYEYCPAVAASGYCSPDIMYSVNNGTAKSVVDYWCPYSCSSEKCTVSDDVANSVPMVCVDRYPNCTALIADDPVASCAGSFQDYAVDAYWCPVTCRYCNRTSTPNTCMDRHPAECFNLATNNYCQSTFLDKSVANFWCQRTCEACKSNETVDTCYPYRHVVDSGETLRSIALDYGVSVQDIWNYNNITNALEDIYDGRALTIPCAGYITPVNLDGSAPGDCPIYILQKDEDLVKLAGKLGFAISDMLLANPDVLDITAVGPGDTINIPPCFALFEHEGIELASDE